MRDAITVAVALALGIAMILLFRMIKGLQAQINESAQRRAADYEAVKKLLEEDEAAEGPKRRHLWLVPVFAGLAAAAGWVRQHPVPAAAGAAAAGAAVLALLPGSSPPDSAMPPTPPAPTTTTMSPRSPSLTIPVPAPGVPSKIPAGGTATSAVSALDVSTSSAPTAALTTTGRPPTTPPTTATMPPTSSTQPEPVLCLLDIELSPVLTLCLPVPV